LSFRLDLVGFERLTWLFCSEACKILLSVSARSGSAEARMRLRLTFYSSRVSKSSN
jgi:hypothetical protein